MNDQQRTDTQNRSLHLWFRQVAKALNDAGIDQRATIEALQTRGLDVPWTDTAFKENVWKPIYKAMSGHESTTEAGRTDYNAEYTGLCKWFGQEFGVTLPPWPDRFSQSQEFAERLYTDDTGKT